MGAVSTSYMFGKLRQNNTQTSKPSATTDDADFYDDLDDVLYSVSLSGNYSMLQLVINFMKNMTPYDLFSFFDSFSQIESDIFRRNNVDYTQIRESYEKHRTLINTSYVNFIIEYYRESHTKMMDGSIEYTPEQKAFLQERFSAVMSLLIEIGKRVSSDYYRDIIVDDDN